MLFRPPFFLVHCVCKYLSFLFPLFSYYALRFFFLPLLAFRYFLPFIFTFFFFLSSIIHFSLFFPLFTISHSNERSIYYQRRFADMACVTREHGPTHCR
ncbi:hypothetical protein STCU_10227 [Strigomonas culicis]|uniref:Uncharacterized protein n=1 Tax=Strigomonas culicis TaxID=28005 RepID=S9V592_9TRYP|nr:hypothetical protein STCU_10227 [Strigomonas culicis]|eukprot:EPY18045.1 hypothetical protein STCU_10227 [Strigomonas culicis]